MNRPLALIEGDLALPIARPFDSLPPPFGSRRRSALAAARRDPQSVSRTDAQQAIQNAVQRRESSPHRAPFPAGVKFLLFYKLPQQRDHSRRFDEQLAEARYYLDMGRARPRSTRSDHLLGAAIFAGCSIALAWLLIASRAHDAGKAVGTATGAMTRAVAIHSPAEFSGAVVQSEPSAANSSLQVAASGAPTRVDPTANAAASGAPTRVDATANAAASGASTSVNATPNAPASREPAPKNGTPKAEAFTAPTPTKANLGPALGNPPTSAPQRADHLPPNSATRASTHPTAPSHPVNTNRAAPLGRFSTAQVDRRLALSRTTHPATQPSASGSAEWAAHRTSASEAAERAALLNWAVQQRRAAITTRADVPTPGAADWSASMTQRRITDDPDAFQTERGTK